MDHAAQEPIFTAKLTPHRSLTHRGLCRLVGGIAVLSGLTGTLFWRMGAWPVAGFTGAEILAALLLIRHHARTGRMAEHILVLPDMLHIIRTDRQGRSTSTAMSHAWLDVGLGTGRHGREAVLLTRHGCATEIGSCLSLPERRDLVRALRDALHQARHPVFDNPQLRS